MNNFLAYITWNVNPNIIESPIMVRYYGLLWALSFFVGLYIMKKLMNNDKAPDSYTDKIFIYVFIGSILGARLGHVFFYDWDAYKDNLIDIFKIWEGGLASHGGLIGVVIAIWLYTKRVSKKSFFWTADKVVVTVAIAASMIRVGNLMNSEIIGIKSDSNAALFFEYEAKHQLTQMLEEGTKGKIKVVSVEINEDSSTSNGPIGQVRIGVQSVNGDLTEEYLNNLTIGLIGRLEATYDPKESHIQAIGNKVDLVSANGSSGLIAFQVNIIPRIPTQIWEAFAYLLIFIVMMFGYWKKHWYRKEGLLFGLFLTLLFGARFIIEFWKEHQTLADDAALNMGQWLSIPAVLVGLFFVIRALRLPETDTTVIPQETITK